jgi:hypothetical protein
MKKYICYSLLFVICFSLDTVAQGTLKTVDAYIKKNDYEKALQQLQILLNNPAQLKGDDLPMAYILRAKTNINLLDIAVKKNVPEEIDKNKDAYFLAFQDLQEAKKVPAGESVKKEIAVVSDYLHQTLRMLGAKILNHLYTTEKRLRESDKTASLDQAQKYLMAAITIREDDYLSHDFYGQVMMLKKADDMAMEHYEKSKKYFKVLDKDIPDFEHFRIFGNMAILNMKKKDSDKALKLIEEGKLGLDQLYQQTAPVIEDIKQAYAKMKSDLEGIEMDIYLNSPDKLELALKKFSETVKAKPDNYSLRLAYAQLLETNKNFEAAAAQYEAAVKLDSSAYLAWFNLGAIHFNNGMELSASIKDPKNPDPKTNEKMRALLLKSVDPFKKALEINKNDLDCIDTLMKVYSRLEMKEEYLYYRALKTEKLKGG